VNAVFHLAENGLFPKAVSEFWRYYLGGINSRWVCWIWQQ